jgi:outer membrane protein TolC
VAALRDAVLERRAALARYQTAVTAAAEVERIARVSYDAGERSILELLDAYRTAADARLRLAALEAAVGEAEIELEFASGWEMSS